MLGRSFCNSGLNLFSAIGASSQARQQGNPSAFNYLSTFCLTRTASCICTLAGLFQLPLRGHEHRLRFEPCLARSSALATLLQPWPANMRRTTFQNTTLHKGKSSGLVEKLALPQPCSLRDRFVSLQAATAGFLIGSDHVDA